MDQDTRRFLPPMILKSEFEFHRKYDCYVHISSVPLLSGSRYRPCDRSVLHPRSSTKCL